MKKLILGLATTLVSLNVHAATLDCRLLEINDNYYDVKPVRIQTSESPQVIGFLGREKVSITEINGFIIISMSEVSVGAKSGNLYLSIEGLQVDCQRVR